MRGFTDSPFIGNGPLIRTRQVVSSLPVLKILPVGDSRTVGSFFAGWRRCLAGIMRAGGFDFQFLGGELGTDGYRFILHDWRHEGHAGEFWHDMTAAIAARVAVAGQPDVVLVDLGTNDCLTHMAIADIKADALAGIAAIRAACPSAWIVVGTINPLTADGAGDALRVLYNAWLLSLNGTIANCSCVDVANGLTKADLGDNVHPNERGNAAIARGWYNEIERLFPMRRGLPLTRSCMKKTANTHSLLVATDNTDGIRALNTTGCGLHAGLSYVLSEWFCPTVLDASGQAIVGFGSYGATGWQLQIGNGATLDNLTIYLQGAAGVPTGDSPITLNTWARISVGFFTQISASDVRPVCAIWVNGKLLLMFVTAAVVDSAAQYLRCGFDASTGTHGCPGYHDNLSVAQWAGAPYFDAARELVERDYYEGSPVQPQLAYYGLNNALTDVFGGGAAELVGGGAFAASGIAKPCDP